MVDRYGLRFNDEHLKLASEPECDMDNVVTANHRPTLEDIGGSVLNGQATPC
jgi:hypothetical protein